MQDKNELYTSILDWSSARIDKLYTRAQRSKNPILRRMYHDNAIALEEEYFDWYADNNAGKGVNVLFIPYHRGIKDGSDSKDSRWYDV
jgi:hypothetical protein